MRPKRRRIAEVITEKLGEGQSLKSLAREIAAYLLAEGRSKELDLITRDVIKLRAEKGFIESSATTAHELKPEAEKSLHDLIKSVRPNAKKIIIDHKLNPYLIGGVRLDIINQRLDLSVRAKLNKLKHLTSNGGIK
jgi:F0F1-type ATP synthase delta subunit